MACYVTGSAEGDRAYDAEMRTLREHGHEVRDVRLEELQELTRLLCEVCTTLEETPGSDGSESLMRELFNKCLLSHRVTEWWSAHKKIDAERIARRRREAEARLKAAEEAKAKKRAREAALAKLTPEERRALGV